MPMPSTHKLTPYDTEYGGLVWVAIFYWLLKTQRSCRVDLSLVLVGSVYFASILLNK